MDNYMDFRRVYLSALTQLLNEPAGTGPIIGTPETRRIIRQIADLEEAHPVWTECVEDWLAVHHQLQ